ncbi:DUF4388 domain-containing protein [Oceanithermus sp.]
MEGNLSTMPLVGLLELLHAERKSGVLHVEGTPPLTLRLQAGEVVGGGILDWEGLEAIASFDIHTDEGRFRFEPGLQSGKVLMPMQTLLGEWARLNDECRRFLLDIDSPSRAFESLSSTGTYGVFYGGRSIRGAAKRWEVPLVIAMERAWTGLRSGELTPIGRYAWYGLRIRHPHARRRPASPDDLSHQMDGQRNLGDLVASGVEPMRLRRYLIEGILSGDLIFPGRGWLLRDLVWEVEYAQRQLA